MPRGTDLKPAPFEYHAPESVSDAAALLAEYADDVKVLAGGQSLVPILALRLSRFAHLVDLNRVSELAGIERRDGTLLIGAMTRQVDAEHSAEVAAAVPLLAKSIPNIGHFQIRNRGTIGGSLAHADPASELPAVALALDATFEATSVRGARSIPAAEFFQGTWTTALADDEMLVATSFPVWDGRCGFGFQEFARRHGDFALAGAACAIELDASGAVVRSAIAMLGVDSAPVRADAAEAGLAGVTPDAATLAAAGLAAAADLDPPDDIHAPGWYRKRIAAHLVERALAEAVQEATGV
jgi:carbon-monoxide dehydrogenase medium subunit